MKFNTVAIIGVGLIGGAIGQGLLRRRMAKSVIGIGRRAASLKAAERMNSVTATTTNLAKGVADADLVIVCTPVDLIAEHARAAAEACPAGALITDAGSTKGSIVATLEEAAQGDAWHSKKVRFLGSHPLAGSEQRGPRKETGDLFVNRVVVVTPTLSTKAADRRALRALWSGLGAKVVEMSAEDHDRAVATTSHAPRVVAAAIAAGTAKEYVRLTAGGWLDTTRIASGDPALWRQILLDNRANVLRSLGEFEARLSALREALARGDGAALEKLLTEAKHVRDAVGS